MFFHRSSVVRMSSEKHFSCFVKVCVCGARSVFPPFTRLSKQKLQKTVRSQENLLFLSKTAGEVSSYRVPITKFFTIKNEMLLMENVFSLQALFFHFEYFFGFFLRGKNDFIHLPTFRALPQNWDRAATHPCISVVTLK